MFYKLYARSPPLSNGRQPGIQSLVLFLLNQCLDQAGGAAPNGFPLAMVVLPADLIHSPLRFPHPSNFDGAARATHASLPRCGSPTRMLQIACFESKYTYNARRPATAIQLADSATNPATAAEADWGPVVPTPPHPEYPAAHSCGAGAVA